MLVALKCLNHVGHPAYLLCYFNMALKTASKNLLLLGTCVPCLKKFTSRICVTRLDLDTNLNYYFKKKDYFFAHDPQHLCQSGDLVLIKELPEKMTTLVTHKVLEVVHKLGDVEDPITGKKVVVGLYRDEIEERTSRYGKRETAFDYTKAPRRGWQQGKKDFTHRESYIKYHEFDDRDQPFAL